MERLLNLLSIFSVVLIVLVLTSLRRAHIRVEYSVSWLAAAVFLFILSRSQVFLDWLTARLGLPDTPLVLALLVSCVFLVVFYRFSVVISTLKDHNIALAQRVAILEFRLASLYEDQTNKEGR